MAISVFGGTGFVGKYFCEQSKHKVNLIPRESRIPSDEVILYLISTTHNYHVFDDVHKDIDTNLTILVDVLKNLKPGKSIFNFVSSWFVYGENELPVDESSYCHPKGFYSITKKAAEELIISYCETFGINYRILRLCNVYGAGDSGASKKKNALQYLIDRFKANEAVELYHNGNFFRDYMHVKDVARAIECVMEKGNLNEIYNIGSGEKLLFKDIIDLVVKFTSSNSKILSVDPPKFHQVVQVKDFYMKTDKLNALGFKKQISIEEGIKQLCH